MNDPINHPSHYTQGGIECIDAIEAALGPEGFRAYCRGCIIKYSWRTGLKDDPAQDLQKAAWYARRAAGVKDEPKAPLPCYLPAVFIPIVLAAKQMADRMRREGGK